MPIGVDVQLAPEFLDLFMKMPRKRPNPARKHVYDGVLDMMLADIGKASVHGGHIIINRLRRTDVGDLYLKTPSVVVLKFAILGCLAGNVVLEVWLVLVILGQLIHKGLVATVAARNPL